MTAPASPTTAVNCEELRQLFSRGEYESLLIRTDNLQKRKRIDDATTKQFIDLVRALSLVQLGRVMEAAPLLSKELASGSGALGNAAKYARLYLAWTTNDGVESAVVEASSLPGEDAWRLEAQLLYRSGRYEEAAKIYLTGFRKAEATLEDKKKPVTTSRWRLMSREPAPPPVTAAELERYTDAVNELATNAMAALVLAGRTAEAIGLKSGIRPSYEVEYNTACVYISQARYEQADVSLQQAEALIRAGLDDDDDDIDETIAPIVVQKAYLRHLAGDIVEAKAVYEDVIADARADAASLAVAANNLTVALGQVAFGRAASFGTERSLLPKEQHSALVEGLKKMRATSGKAVARKLTTSQRRAMARNRAILLVQMGRMDACRTELAKLKSEFPGDPVVPLIEASLIARQSGLETADKVLQLAGDSQNVRAARVQLAVSLGEKKRAAELLRELFAGRPAAVVTAAHLLKDVGEVEEALGLLREMVISCPSSQKPAAKKMLAEMLLRINKYEEAASILREVVKADGSDSMAAAKLVVATSYFDAKEAEETAAKIVPMLDTKGVDVTALEALPPPKRKQVAALRNNESVKDLKLEENDAAARAATARERRKRKRKKRLPKDYDPNGPPPDPERWLPKTLRSGYKKKRNKTDNFKGSQGADAAAADAAAVKNAERSASKAAAIAVDSTTVPGGRSRAQKKKKNRR